MEEGFQEVQLLLQLAQTLVEKKEACDSTEGLLRIMQVKERNKKLCAATEGAKEATTRSKNDLEGAYTALQNLLYEKNHFENEIASCQGFQSKVKEEAVALMPEQEFLASSEGQAFLREQEERLKNPEKNGAAANGTIAGLTPEQTLELREGHQLMRARLGHEGKQRLELLRQLEQVKQMEASLKEAVGSQEQVLHDLQSSLKNLEKTAEPMNKVLAPTTGIRDKTGKAADLLPTPLYIIYSQLVAAREAMHINCNTSIAGNVEEAQQFASAEAQEPQAGDDPYKAHPLSVEMKLLRDPPPPGAIAQIPAIDPNTVSRPLTRVIFEYLPSLRVVTAHAIPPADNNLLKAMFPEDDGSALPPEVAMHLQGPSFKYSSSRVPRPYRWCQHLAGLDFGQVLSGLDIYRRQQRVVTFIQRLHLIPNLTKNQLPTDMSVFPRPPLSHIVFKEEIREASAAGPPPTPSKPQRKRSPVPAPPPSNQGAVQQQQQQQQQQQAGGEDEHMAEQAVEPEAGAPQGSPLEEDLMLDEEGAVVEGGEVGANGNGGNGHEQQQAEAAGRSQQPYPTCTHAAHGQHTRKRGRKASSNAAAMLLLHEGEEEERKHSVTLAAVLRPTQTTHTQVLHLHPCRPQVEAWPGGIVQCCSHAAAARG
ncbi:Fms-interacting protein-domain-containing protein [Dunaliella salina]|uniref:Fms-interacting protein-domain-containing protein n=1 Tax=Dunaliella salina TaxID=3046 RepID=A0ABQ7FZX3_DUNSA|nr:Fms-interacting protein-domain-containing protein [Dunaliella salina]|eukprot:KAF5827904.1 Fms-interacting protein-domain-containing protein [Dunaliella salina]